MYPPRDCCLDRAIALPDPSPSEAHKGRFFADTTLISGALHRISPEEGGVERAHMMLLSIPHPNPLPEGEGTENLPL